MKKSKIIGVALILISVGIVGYSLMVNWRVDRAFDVARNEVLLVAHGASVGQAGTFCVTYRHAHGVEVHNADVVYEKDAKSANVELLNNGNVTLLAFSDKSTWPVRNIYDGDTVVKVISSFDGDMLFKNLVCGCEKTGPMFLVFISGVVGLILSGTGLFLMLKKDSCRVVDTDM
ncbi:MAG: hypothetical protein K9M57_01070 [Phycisphaerae bacterium]|nr:hypothetical protein [Phycisphaerae bacterium]